MSRPRHRLTFARSRMAKCSTSVSAHFSGSVCGRALSGKPSSTMGFERRHNAAFQPRSLDEFRAFIMASLPPKPPEFHRIVDENLGRAPG